MTYKSLVLWNLGNVFLALLVGLCWALGIAVHNNFHVPAVLGGAILTGSFLIHTIFTVAILVENLMKVK